MVPLLSDLREPPVAGRFYMVPAIYTHRQFEADRWWPVLGPLHTDADTFPAFPWAHYHYDGRFLNTHHTRLLRRPFLEAVGSSVTHDNPTWHRKLPRGVPMLRRMKCVRETYGYAYHDKPEPQTIKDKYGDPAEPRRLADGRLLCPHRKVDLSSFPPDADGIVVCPLHGLRVRCFPAASAPPSLSAQASSSAASGGDAAHGARP